MVFRHIIHTSPPKQSHIAYAIAYPLIRSSLTIQLRAFEPMCSERYVLRLNKKTVSQGIIRVPHRADSQDKTFALLLQQSKPLALSERTVVQITLTRFTEPVPHRGRCQCPGLSVSWSSRDVNWMLQSRTRNS